MMLFITGFIVGMLVSFIVLMLLIIAGGDFVELDEVEHWPLH